MEPIESRRIQLRFTRALPTYDGQSDAQRLIARKLATLLPRNEGGGYKRVLEIGCGTGGFTEALRQQGEIGEWVLNDLCEACREKVSRLFPGAPPRFMAGDAETLPFPGRFDLIASASVFQWMREPERFLRKLAGLLEPGGVLLFSTFLPGNLHEVKELTGIGLDYPAAETLAGWLAAAGFEQIRREEESILLTFASPAEVLRHLKATGVTATGSGRWTRGRQEAFCRHYSERFAAAGGGVRLTYRPLYVTAVKR